jgi:hypothetical protein
MTDEFREQARVSFDKTTSYAIRIFVSLAFQHASICPNGSILLEYGDSKCRISFLNQQWTQKRAIQTPGPDSITSFTAQIL